MKVTLDDFNEYIDAFTLQRDEAQANLDNALKERKAFLESRHIYTAADYRIVLIPDEISFEFDDIMGDAPEEGDSEGFKERYRAMYEAYHSTQGNGIYALLVSAQKRDVETGEFEESECCAGLFYLESDSQKSIFAEARDIAQDFIELPEGVTIADIQVVSAEDA